MPRMFFFTSLLTVCLPLHDAVWHLSGSDPYNILRCWERCCLYQSAEQPWADCSASPSLIQVAPAGSAAEKYHQRKGVSHMCWDQNSPGLLIPPLHGLQKHAVLTIWSVKICRSAGAPCKGKKAASDSKPGWAGQAWLALRDGQLLPCLSSCRWPLSKPQQWS